MKVLGIILIVIGILMFVLPGINYTKKEKLIDAGPVEITKKENKTLTWPVYAGGVAVVAGIIVLVVGGRKNS